MDPILAEWLSLAIRWVHVMTGIMWIGTSFFFIWLDASLRHYAAPKPGIAGESWLVHGGGFYAVEKFLVAPGSMPQELHWFKYEAYFTWVSGFLLLALIYYYGAEQNLIDPSVSDLGAGQAILVSLGLLAGGWVLYDVLCRCPIGRSTGALAVGVFLLVALAAYVSTELFSGRAAYLHVGAFIGTMMAANVFMIIIPNQKKVVKALLAGEAPDPALGKQAKQRSLHNNYLTLPVVLMMISNHYPIMYESAYRWLFVMGAVTLSGLLRAYANARHAGVKIAKVDYLLVIATGLGLVLSALPALKNGPEIAVGREVDLVEAAAIIQQRCLACHSATPTDAFFKAPPKGIAFDSAADIRRYAPMIARVAVETRMMPLRNQTGMTDEERALLGAWIAGAATHGAE
ncbi:urate hydroxylase PuuD [Dongia sp.]|uniref:urate hydroxylase PuuD n=1 Tax=Dongia sp. TaxID=1977262 RepID=UPI0035ADE31E